MQKSKTHDEYCMELKVKEINAIPVEKYIGVKNKIKHMCLKHNVYFYSTPGNLLHGSFSCPECKKEKKLNVANSLRMSQKEYEHKVSLVNPYIKIISKYITINNKVTYRCLDCGYEDIVSASSLLIKRPCVNCGKRNNSIKDADFINKLNENYPNLEYKGELKTLNSKLDFHCNIHDYSWKTAARIGRDYGCPVCNGKIRSDKSYHTELHGLNSYVYPIENIKTSHDKSLHKCSICSSEFYVSPSQLVAKLQKNLGLCPFCSDGISYPNKMIRSIVRQLTSLLLAYSFEYSPKWAKYTLNDKSHKGYYDAKIVTKHNIKLIVEMDGGFHNKDNNMSGQTMQISKEIDLIKDNLAESHGFTVVRIDCDYANNDRFEFIKSNILSNEFLKKEIDLSRIDWDIVSIESEKSCFTEACTYCKEGLSVKDISIKMSFDTSSIRKYLKRGTQLGLCNYNPKIEYEKSFVKMHENNKKKCICLDTNKIFDSISEASKYYAVSETSISQCCNGKRKSAGGHKWSTDKSYFKDISA